MSLLLLFYWSTHQWWLHSWVHEGMEWSRTKVVWPPLDESSYPYYLEPLLCQVLFMVSTDIRHNDLCLCAHSHPGWGIGLFNCISCSFSSLSLDLCNYIGQWYPCWLPMFLPPRTPCLLAISTDPCKSGPLVTSLDLLPVWAIIKTLPLTVPCCHLICAIPASYPFSCLSRTQMASLPSTLTHKRKLQVSLSVVPVPSPLDHPLLL